MEGVDDDAHRPATEEAAVAKVVRLLLKKRGGGVDVVDDRGRTALHLAAEGGLVRVCELLMEGGAEAFARDHDGRTAIDVAVGSSFHHVCATTLEHLARVDGRNTALIFAVASTTPRPTSVAPRCTARPLEDTYRRSTFFWNGAR